MLYTQKNNFYKQELIKMLEKNVNVYIYNYSFKKKYNEIFRNMALLQAA